MESLIKLITGLSLLIFAILLDYIGASFDSLWILIISMILAIAGAFVGLRGLFEFLGERFSK